MVEDKMEEAMDKEWRTLSEEILSGMKEWRLAHPKATLREIEQEASERVSRRPRANGAGCSSSKPHSRLAVPSSRGATDVPQLCKSLDPTREEETAASRKWRPRGGTEPELWNLSQLWDGAFSRLYEE